MVCLFLFPFLISTACSPSVGGRVFVVNAVVVFVFVVLCTFVVVGENTTQPPDPMSGGRATPTRSRGRSIG